MRELEIFKEKASILAKLSTKMEKLELLHQKYPNLV